jgi:hypothetical protein
MKRKLMIVGGVVIGGVVGFLLWPSVPLLGQLPFTTVITRGANLEGLDQIMLGYARTSFNYLIAGIVVGGVIGVLAAVVLSRGERVTGPRTS